MKHNEVVVITGDEAIKEVKKEGKKIHCFLGFIGADWDKKSVIDLLKKAKRIAWADNPFNHNLVAIDEGKRYCFDIKH